MNTMEEMNTMGELCIDNRETLKDIIENMSAINNEMNLQLHMIADALVYGKHPTNNDTNPDELLTIMDSVRNERDKAEENLKLLISIREYLW